MTTLLDRTLTTALTAEAQTALTIHGGVRAIGLVARFDVVGTSGTSCKAWVQTSLDGGSTYHDIACFAFGTASAIKRAALPGASAINPTAITDGSLADDTVNDGPFGRKYRVKLTSVGSFGAGTQLRIDMEPHL